jgi:hypothetical protein
MCVDPAGAGGRKGAMVLRWVDGATVWMRRGEKFLDVKPDKPDPSTVVSIKVKSKGKRGPGPGWKK